VTSTDNPECAASVFDAYSDFGSAGKQDPEVPRLEVHSPGKEFSEISRRFHIELLEQIDLDALSKLSESGQLIQLRLAAERLIDVKNLPLNSAQRALFIQEILDEIVGLGPLEKLLRDSSATDILVNGAHQVYVERNGKLEESEVHFRDDQHLLQIIQRIVAKVGRRVDQASPIVDARLLDGSRVNAIIPPLSLRGPTLSIRRFGANPLRLEDLLRLKALTPEMADFLRAAVKSRINILISGGTGSGKTTLLNTLSAFIPDTERIISVEDAAELQLQQRHVVQLEARPVNVEGKGEVTMRDLVRNTLRMRPNRIIIGECRGAEAFDMLQAMNTGHEGSLTTLHANSPHDALARLEMMLMMAGMEVPLHAMRAQIVSAISLIVQVDRLPGGRRRVTSVTEVTGREGEVVTTQEIFRFKQLGIDESGNAFGQFEGMGVRPYLMPRLQAASIELPAALFSERVLMMA
jgi:pilus assembly protein CpaF